MRRILYLLIKSKRGATAIEYGLIVTFIALACMAAMNSLADNTLGMWSFVQTKIAPTPGG